MLGTVELVQPLDVTRGEEKTMSEPTPGMPEEIEGLLELVQEHHRRLHEHHHWTGREPLVTTVGAGARCVGVRCYLEPALYGSLETYLAAQGLEAHCCPEADLTEAQGQGWEVLHLRDEFRGVEFVFQGRTVLCRRG